MRNNKRTKELNTEERTSSQATSETKQASQLTPEQNLTNATATSSPKSHKRNLKEEFIEQAVEAGSALAHNLFPEEIIDDLDVQEQKVLEQAKQVQQLVRQNLNSAKSSSEQNLNHHNHLKNSTSKLNFNLNLDEEDEEDQVDKEDKTNTVSSTELAPVYPRNQDNLFVDAGTSLFGDLFVGNYKSFEHLTTTQNSILLNSLERAIDSCSKQLKSNMFVICGSDHAFVPQIMHTCVEFGDECGLDGKDILFLDMHDLIGRVDIDATAPTQIKLPIKPLTILTNIQLAIGNKLWEKVLINLINQVTHANTTLITSSKYNLDSLQFYYSDLASRFSRFYVFILQPESKELIRQYILNYSEQINLNLPKRTMDLLINMIYQDPDIEIESTLECLLVLCLNLNIPPQKLTCSQLRQHASEFILFEMIDW